MNSTGLQNINQGTKSILYGLVVGKINSRYISYSITLLQAVSPSVSDTVQLAVVTATILVMLLVNIISNCVNTKLLLVIKQARDYGGKPGMKLTASRKPSNTVEDMSALALPTTKQFLSIRQPPFVPLAHVTNTGPSLPLRYDFDVCRQSNSEDCQIGCDNDSSPSCVPACHCDSQLTDTDSSEIPVISMDLTLSQPFQPSFPLDEETSLKMTD